MTIRLTQRGAGKFIHAGLSGRGRLPINERPYFRWREPGKTYWSYGLRNKIGVEVQYRVRISSLAAVDVNAITTELYYDKPVYMEWQDNYFGTGRYRYLYKLKLNILPKAVLEDTTYLYIEGVLQTLDYEYHRRKWEYWGGWGSYQYYDDPNYNPYTISFYTNNGVLGFVNYHEVADVSLNQDVIGTLSINRGVDVMSDKYSLRISSCDIELKLDQISPNNLRAGDEISVYQDTSKIFGGVINSNRRTQSKGNRKRNHLDILGYGSLLQRMYNPQTGSSSVYRPRYLRKALQRLVALAGIKNIPIVNNLNDKAIDFSASKQWFDLGYVDGWKVLKEIIESNTTGRIEEDLEGTYTLTKDALSTTPDLIVTTPNSIELPESRRTGALGVSFIRGSREYVYPASTPFDEAVRLGNDKNIKLTQAAAVSLLRYTELSEEHLLLRYNVIPDNWIPLLLPWNLIQFDLEGVTKKFRVLNVSIQLQSRWSGDIFGYYEV